MRCRANKRKEKPHIDERRINAKKRGIISRTMNKAYRHDMPDNKQNINPH